MACGMLAVAVSPQICHNRTVEYGSREATQGFLLVAGAYDFLNLTLNFFSEIARP